MRDEIKNLLACPNCKKELIFDENKIICAECKSNYKVVNDSPVFLNKKLSNAEVSVGGFRDKLRKNPYFFKTFEKIHNILGPPSSTYEKKAPFGDNKIDVPLRDLLIGNEKKKILNIGSSPKNAYKSSINLDIDLFDNVDVVADGKYLPFKSASFDIVIIEMVLEHVDEAEKVVQEAYRVLKKNGLIYVSIPFVFAFHGSPNDFNRYTLNGLKRRFEISGFKVKKQGILSGPSSTMSQILRYYLAMLFSFNSDFLYSFFLNLFGWLTFPIKYLDILLNKHKKAHLIAATIYGIGVK